MRKRYRRRGGLVRNGHQHVEWLLLDGYDQRRLAVHQSVRHQLAHQQSNVIYQVEQIVTRQMLPNKVSRLASARMLRGKEKDFKRNDRRFIQDLHLVNSGEDPAFTEAGPTQNQARTGRGVHNQSRYTPHAGLMPTPTGPSVGVGLFLITRGLAGCQAERRDIAAGMISGIDVTEGQVGCTKVAQTFIHTTSDRSAKGGGPRGVAPAGNEVTVTVTCTTNRYASGLTRLGGVER